VILPFGLRKPVRKKSEVMRMILEHMAEILAPGRDAEPHHGLTLVQSAEGKRRPKPAAAAFLECEEKKETERL